MKMEKNKKAIAKPAPLNVNIQSRLCNRLTTKKMQLSNVEIRKGIKRGTIGLHRRKKAPDKFQGDMFSEEIERAPNILMANIALNKVVIISVCQVRGLCETKGQHNHSLSQSNFREDSGFITQSSIPTLLTFVRLFHMTDNPWRGYFT